MDINNSNAIAEPTSRDPITDMQCEHLKIPSMDKNLLSRPMGPFIPYGNKKILNDQLTFDEMSATAEDFDQNGETVPNSSVDLASTGDAECADLLKNLTENLSTGLASVSIAKTSFGDAAAAQLAKLTARGCGSLRTLVIHHASVSSSGARLLAAGLSLHAALHTLDLAHNSCGDAGAVGLATLVRSSPALRVLRLGDNAIGAAGAEALALSLLPLPAPRTTARRMIPCGAGGALLEELDLSDNAVGDRGAEALACALRRSVALRSLAVSSSGLSAAGLERLRQAATAASDKGPLHLG